jgi:hypothetical protein
MDSFYADRKQSKSETKNKERINERRKRDKNEARNACWISAMPIYYTSIF